MIERLGDVARRYVLRTPAIKRRLAHFQGLHHATWITWSAVAWQSVGNTMFGYGVWAWLLARHPAATVSPLSLLVPVVGFAASALILGEPLETWKIEAGLLVMSGLALNLLWGRRKSSFAAVPERTPS